MRFLITKNYSYNLFELAKIASVILCIDLAEPIAFCADLKESSGSNLLTTKEALIPAEASLIRPGIKSSVKLEGKAEVNTALDSKERAAKAGKLYKDGMAALNSRNLSLAADYFQKAGDAFESIIGWERYLAEARYAEAQSRRLLGQTKQATILYKSAVDLFQEYDPLSPYLKPSLDELKKSSPALQGEVARAEAKLQAMIQSGRIVMVDRNVVLKGSITDSGTENLLAEKGTTDVTSDYLHKTVRQAFIKMTCLETADLGSNYNTAEAKWLPLIANGRTVTIGAASGFTAPIISVKLNGRFYNVSVDLPELSSSRRTVFLMTDGAKIVAIDPASGDVWLMIANIKEKTADFHWKKLHHRKDKRSPK